MPPFKSLLSKETRNISRHYDVGNDFYRLFLGRDMIYSCAYFKNGDEDVDEAQRNKLEHICRKLRLQPGEKFLDIGCGWGGLIVYAVKKYKVHAYGITLSQKQYEYAKEWIKKENLDGLCKVEIKNYRELEGENIFDKVASIGMFEHVGIKNLPTYFNIIRRVLKEKGLFLNHGITEELKSKRTTLGTKFINTYVFSGGELTQIADILRFMSDAGFEIVDLESLRNHYMKTLRLWANNLRNQKEEAMRIVNQKTYRTWVLFMAACSYGFKRGNINVYQVLASKHTGFGLSKHPLTREDLYI